jgi:hypothetical protein
MFVDREEDQFEFLLYQLNDFFVLASFNLASRTAIVASTTVNSCVTSCNWRGASAVLILIELILLLFYSIKLISLTY